MFELSLVDHLRLTFGHVIYRQKTHARTALVHARWSRALRAGEAGLIAGAAIAAAGAALGHGIGYSIAAAVLASLALIAVLANLLFDFDRSAAAHRECSAQLWRIRESYRALLSDLRDGVIDITAARTWRDGLMRELHAIYENAPPADRQMYQMSRNAANTADDAALTDEEIDRFLPPSLQKTGKSAA